MSKTFLQLCADLARESGAIGAAPSAVTGQSGRQEKCVNWIINAWTLIQNENPDWSFLRGEFEDVLAPNTTSYTAASFNLDRFGEWLGDRPLGNGYWYRPLTIYDAAYPERERTLSEIPYEVWRVRYDRGVHDAQEPSNYSRAPDQSLRIGPKPDAAYVVRGEYRKSPQVLAANTDIPDLPERFHDVIWCRAIMLIAEHDESTSGVASAMNKYSSLMGAMQRDLLPKVTVRPGYLR